MAPWWAGRLVKHPVEIAGEHRNGFLTVLKAEHVIAGPHSRPILRNTPFVMVQTSKGCGRERRRKEMHAEWTPLHFGIAAIRL